MTDDIESSPTIEPAIEAAPAVPPRPSQWQTWGEILLCSGYPTQILIGGLLMAVGMSPGTSAATLSPRFVFALSMIDTVFLLTLIVVLLVRRGERPMQVFFGHRSKAGEVAFGILSLPFVLAIVLTLMVIIMRIAPELNNVPKNPLENFLATPAGVWMFLFVAIVAGGVREELQRAFLLHRFKHDLGQPWLGLLVASIAFGLGHTLQGHHAAIITGVLGATWGAMYLIRGGALASMVSHSLFNSAELLRIVLR